MIFKKCPNCEFENPETAKFCNECGAKLSPEQIPPSPVQEPLQEPSPPTPSEPAALEPVVTPVETPTETPEAGPVFSAEPSESEPAALEPVVPPVETSAAAPEAGPVFSAEPSESEPAASPAEIPVQPSEPPPLSPSEAPQPGPEEMTAPESSAVPSESAVTLPEQPDAFPFGWIEPTPPEESVQADSASSEIALEPPPLAAEAGPEPAASPETAQIPVVAVTDPEAQPTTPGEPLPPEAETAPEEHAVEEPSSQHPFGARFKVGEKLGTGTLGTVFKVFDKAMERDVALKAIGAEMAQKAEAFEGFGRELKAERSLVHKNIARIFELSVAKGTPFITMEYVTGRDLKALLKEKKRLPIGEVFSTTKQLASGLAYAHGHGALHLDLRPDNIMIDKEGTAKIMDLGIIRLFRAKGIIRAVGGKPQYMSPEQLEGQEGDARSDIYALGAIVYEMLTGNLPPVGETPRSPRELNSAVPRELSLLVLKCLEQEKEKRYQTAQEIRAELEELEDQAGQMPAEAPAQPVPERPVEPRPAMGATAVPAEAAEKPVQPARARQKTSGRRAFPFPSKAAFPILAVLAVIVLAFILWRFVLKPSKAAPTSPAAPTKVSLAVLPFEDLSPAKDRQPLGAVIAESIIRALEKVDDLSVPAASSSSSFQGKARDSRLVGRRLRVDHYLEGTFEERENRIKIDARLLRADTGAPLWSGQFERTSGEIFAIQAEIAQAVAKSLGVSGPPESASPERPGAPVNFEAYDLYAQGRYLMNKRGKVNLEKAVDLFTKAGADDPAFALAFAAIADAHIQLAFGHHLTPDKAFPKAKDAALKALLLDAGLTEAHTAFGRIKTHYERDFQAGEKEFREALRIDPDNAAAHQCYALLLSALGRHGEAVKEIQTAQTLSPLSSEINSQAGLILYFGRLYEQAEAEVKKAIATDPLYPGHHFNAALIRIQMGQYDQAMQSLKEAEDFGENPMEVNLRRAYVHARQGQRQEVGRILTAALNADKNTYVSQLSLALVYAGLTEKDQAIACLENAVADRDPSLIFMRVHPFLDTVRGDMRFVVLLQKIGLAPY